MVKKVVTDTQRGLRQNLLPQGQQIFFDLTVGRARVGGAGNWVCQWRWQAGVINFSNAAFRQSAKYADTPGHHVIWQAHPERPLQAISAQANLSGYPSM